MANKGRATSEELVPLAQRVTYMQIFRVAMVLGVLALAAYSPETLGDQGSRLLAGGGIYLGVSLLAQGLWKVLGGRSLYLFGLMLIGDGVFLAWLNFVTGSGSSALRALILLHLIAATLLASYRTGLKLAMWHTILLLLVHYAEVSDAIQPVSGSAAGEPDFHLLVSFIAVLWVGALATATFSAVNERELRRRRYDMEALALMSEELDSAIQTQEVAGILLASLVDSFSFSRGVILGARGQTISLLASQGPGMPEQSEDLSLSIDPIMQVAWDTKQTQLISELGRNDACLRGLVEDWGNLLIVPLMAEGGKAGVAVLEHPVKHGSRVERRLVAIVERFCAQGALALRNSILLRELRDMATTDGLTKVANRRTFEIKLRQELARAERESSSLSLIILDIDHFKRLNDTHGHQTGDEVLKAVGATLEEHCREFDTAARYGGEEFTMILPGSDAADGLSIANRLRTAISSMNSEVPVTVSAGVASYPIHATDGELLLKRADKALYASKHAGRDRVTGYAELVMSQTEE